jgi:hypothetical protein
LVLSLGILYGLGYFLLSFGIFFPYWYVVSRKIWQTWVAALLYLDLAHIFCNLSFSLRIRCLCSRGSSWAESENLSMYQEQAFALWFSEA